MIRQAEEKDMGGIFILGKSFIKEGNLPFKLKKSFKDKWLKIIKNELGNIFVSETNGKIVGAIGCLIFPDINDNRLVAIEAFWYVDKESRGKDGLKLLFSFEG